MKHRLLILAICFVVAASMCLTVSLVTRYQSGLGDFGPSTKPSLSLPGESSDKTPGQVRWYVCHREDRAVCQALAQRYTEETGVAVTVVSGALQTQGQEAASLFCIHNAQTAAQLQGDLYDLSDSGALSALYNPDFALMADGKPVGLAMDVEGYGLLYNAGLLASAGFTRGDIPNFASLQADAQHITQDQKMLGFAAFCAPNGQDLAQAAYLLGMNQSTAQLRDFLKLYTENTTVFGTALEQFAAGKAVFCLGGTKDYAAIAQIGIHNLDILPVFTPDGGSFHFICDTYWSVNAHAGAADIQASLDFLQWVVTADSEGAAPVDSLDWFSPFADAVVAEDPFQKLLRKYMASEPVTVRWEIAAVSDQDLADWAQALAAYLATPSDHTWAAVEQLLLNT